MDRLSDGALHAQRQLPATVLLQRSWLAIALLSAILLNFLQHGGHDTQRIVEVLFLVAGGTALALGGYSMPIVSRVGPGICLALAIFFTAGAVSGALAYSPQRAAYEVGSLLLLLSMSLAIAAGIAREPSAMPGVLRLFAVIAAVYAFRIFSVYVSVWIVQIQPGVGQFTPGFDNIRHFNHAETAGIPLLMLVYLLTPRGSRLRWLWMTTAAVWWAVMFVTAGRGSMVGLAAGCMALLVARGRAALPMLRAMLIGAVGGAAVYIVFFVLAPRAMGMLPFGELAQMVSRSIADPSSGRTYLWKLAVSLIESHPWLGVGPLQFAHYGASLRFGAHPHNWILQIAVEWGVPALVALCVALALAARGLLAAAARIDINDMANKNTAAALILAGAALLVDGLVSGILVMPQSQLMIVLYLACAAGWTWSRSPSRDAVASSTQRRAVSIIVACAVGALVYGIAPQFADKLAGRPQTAAEAQANGTEYAWPRQWGWGYF